MLSLACATGCVLTSRPDELATEPPLTPPVIQDIQGLTTPRLHNLVLIETQTQSAQVGLRVPVDDDNVEDTLQYQFFVDDLRDCVPRDGGVGCEPLTTREIPPNGERRRIVSQQVRVSGLGCHRVELWVSSRFQLSGNFRTPVREGDVSFTTWWVFLRSPSGMSPGTSGDGGVSDPVERCGFIVQP